MDLQVFENNEFGSVRTVALSGEPYFVGKDVAEILGYSNSRKALADHVDEEDKRDGVAIRDAIGREQNPVLINESGLYSLILRSKLPTARKFKRWVTSEILPAICENGMYATDKLLGDPDFAIAVFRRLKAEREEKRKLEQALSEKETAIGVLTPKAEYCDEVLRSEGLLPISVIAKDFGWSAVRMNRFLYAHEVQYPLNKCWLLYRKYAGKGYTKTKTTTYADRNGEVKSKTHTYWTQKGRRFLHGFMKSMGFAPVAGDGN